MASDHDPLPTGRAGQWWCENHGGLIDHGMPCLAGCTEPTLPPPALRRTLTEVGWINVHRDRVEPDCFPKFSTRHLDLRVNDHAAAIREMREQLRVQGEALERRAEEEIEISCPPPTTPPENVRQLLIDMDVMLDLVEGINRACASDELKLPPDLKVNAAQLAALERARMRRQRRIS